VPSTLPLPDQQTTREQRAKPVEAIVSILALLRMPKPSPFDIYALCKLNEGHGEITSQLPTHLALQHRVGVVEHGVHRVGGVTVAAAHHRWSRHDVMPIGRDRLVPLFPFLSPRQF
jgi:hypothetical protein